LAAHNAGGRNTYREDVTMRRFGKIAIAAAYLLGVAGAALKAHASAPVGTPVVATAAAATHIDVAPASAPVTLDAAVLAHTVGAGFWSSFFNAVFETLEILVILYVAYLGYNAGYDLVT
jgi:ABC-type transport system substrate-binding protein